MVYVQQIWNDYEDGGTPLEKERLRYIEAGIAAAAAAADAADAAAAQVQALVRSMANRVWTQNTEPPAGTWHRWTGTPGDSTSERVVDGAVTSTNPIRNGSFEYGITSWSPQTNVTAVSVAGEGLDGGSAVLIERISNISGGDLLAQFGLPVVVGKTYTFSARFRRADPVPTPASFLLRNAYTLDQLNRITEDGWHTFSATFEATTSLLILYVGIRDFTIRDVGLGVYVDHVLLEEASTVRPYFDGDTPDDRARDLWVNTGDDGKIYVWDKGSWVIPS